MFAYPMMLLALAVPTTNTKPPTPPLTVISTAQPQSLVTFLQQEGYRAKLVTTPGENPSIESAAAGAAFSIYFQSCKEHRNCEDVLIKSSYDKRDKDPVTIEAINAFNRESRFVQAYLTKELEPALEMDVIFTDRQMSLKAFGEHIQLWADALGRFHKAIDF